MKRLLTLTFCALAFFSQIATAADNTITFYGKVIKEPSNKEVVHNKCNYSQLDSSKKTTDNQDKLACLKSTHELKLLTENKNITLVAMSI